MHTYSAPDGTTFHYNSDFSGDVIVTTASGDVRVGGEALLAFVAKAFCVPRKISLLEEIGADSENSLNELRNAEPEALLLGTV